MPKAPEQKALSEPGATEDRHLKALRKVAAHVESVVDASDPKPEDPDHPVNPQPTR